MSTNDGPDGSRERIGEGLIRAGALTDDQVTLVLSHQRESTSVERLFGEIAIELGFLDETQLNEYLESTDILKED